METDVSIEQFKFFCLQTPPRRRARNESSRLLGKLRKRYYSPSADTLKIISEFSVFRIISRSGLRYFSGKFRDISWV